MEKVGVSKRPCLLKVEFLSAMNDRLGQDRLTRYKVLGRGRVTFLKP